MNTRNFLASVALGLTASIPIAKSANAYPIDCAILLCLAGGFPASAECSAAKAELIRRITPWPIEPPLQLWRCPMGGGGASLPGGGGFDSLPPEVAQYRDAIELWQISKHVTGASSGGRDVYLTTIRSSYTPTGNWTSQQVRPDDLPDWLDADIQQRTGTTLKNEYGRSFRSIVMRMHDYTGAYSTEWVNY